MMVILIFAVLLLVALLWIIVVINLSFTFYYCLENLYDLLLFSDQDTYFFHRLLMHFCSLIKIIFHFILMTFLFLSWITWSYSHNTFELTLYHHYSTLAALLFIKHKIFLFLSSNNVFCQYDFSLIIVNLRSSYKIIVFLL